MILEIEFDDKLIKLSLNDEFSRKNWPINPFLNLIRMKRIHEIINFFQKWQISAPFWTAGGH